MYLYLENVNIVFANGLRNGNAAVALEDYCHQVSQHKHCRNVLIEVFNELC